MTDWEKAIAHWLPEVWTPKPCKGRLFIPSIANVDWVCMECHQSFDSYVETHTTPCPPPSRDLGFRLLESMKGGCSWNPSFKWWSVDSLDVHNICHDLDLLTAITKAAAAADKKNG